MRKPILAALIAATALVPVMASAQDWQRGGRGGSRGNGGVQSAPRPQAPQQRIERQQQRAERQQQRAVQPQASQVQQDRRQQWQQRREQQQAQPGVTNNGAQRFQGGQPGALRDQQVQQRLQQQRPDRNEFRQERRDDRRDFRQERREDRGALASGQVTRDQFRNDRRDDRRDFRNDRRDDRQDAQRGNRNDWRGNNGWNRGNEWSRGDNRQGNRWNRTWRNDRNYNWQSYRSSNRNAYRLPRYYAPRGYGFGYQRYSIGVTLGALLFSQNYWINDPWSYRLPEAYEPYRWVRYYNDAMLVDIYSGEVVDVIHDIFW